MTEKICAVDLGMPTLLEAAGAEESAALCAELGLQFVELNMNLPEYADPAHMDREKLCALREKYGVYFTLHLDERLDGCDFNPLVRNAYQETLRRALELAQEAEMPIVNLHLNHGVYFTLPGKKTYLYAERREEYLQHIDEMRRIGEEGAEENIALCVENTDGFLAQEKKALDLLMKSKRWGLTLDVGHMHSAGYVDDDVYIVHSGKLRHMHLHDALLMQAGQCHLPLGEGNLDWRNSLRTAEMRHCRAVIEVKTLSALRDSVKTLREGGK